jgi:hypothetical protein
MGANYLFSTFSDSLIDSAKVIPLLLIIFIGIEIVEYKYANKIREAVQKAGTTGPGIGAVTGSFPHVSVIASALYTQRLATVGTLIAVYLASSDEAIPVILSQPERVDIILPLIITKIIIAIIGGYTVDFVFRKRNKKTLTHTSICGRFR